MNWSSCDVPISLIRSSLFLLLVELGRLLAPSPLPMWLGRRGYSSAWCLIHRWLSSCTHLHMGFWISVEGAGSFAQLREQLRPEFPVTPNSSRLIYCTPAGDLRGSVSNHKFFLVTCTYKASSSAPATGHFGDRTSSMSWSKASQKPPISNSVFPDSFGNHITMGVDPSYAWAASKIWNGLKHRSRLKQELGGYSWPAACSLVAWRYSRIDLHYYIYQTCTLTPIPPKLVASTSDQQFKYL